MSLSPELLRAAATNPYTLIAFLLITAINAFGILTKNAKVAVQITTVVSIYFVIAMVVYRVTDNHATRPENNSLTVVGNCNATAQGRNNSVSTDCGKQDQK